MNEFELIDRFFRRPVRDPAVRLGVGDDAAIVAPAPGCELALAVDMLVEGRHFLPDVDPAALGHKTLAVNLSDMAAMGATPRWALLGGALPADDADWLAAFCGGLFALAARYAVTLVGGDTTRGPRNLCLTIVGEVPAGTALTRAGARPGDDLHVSGRLGDAALALAALQGRASLPAATLAALRRRLDEPEPRVALGERLRGVATAAIDVSTGWSATWATCWRARAWARRSSSPRSRVHPRSTRRYAGPGARSRSSACWPAATTTSSCSRRRLRRARTSRRSRASSA